LSGVRKDLRAMTADGMASSVMVGIGETYLPAFVLAISSSQVACGLVSTVPMVIGAVLQLCAPRAIRHLGSYRRWVVLAAVAQALGFLPLLAAAIVGSMSVTTIFLVVAVYWATGMGGGTAWNAWAGTLVPERIRGPYFAWRTRFTQLGIMLGLAAGGILLQLGKGWGWLPGAFAAIFLTATISRMFSAYFLTLQHEPTPPNHPRLPQLGELFAAVRQHRVSRVILYMLAAQTACQIAGPYFNPYMLGQLKLSYVHYLILICTPYVARVACSTAWGHLVDRVGLHRVLWLSGLLVAPLPLLWNFSDSFAYLMAVQTYAGLTWAGYELAQLLLFFDTIPTERRVGTLTLFNLFNAMAIFLGSIVGGLILAELGAGREAYRMLFLASTLVRIAAMLVLVRLPAWAAKRRSISSPALAMPRGLEISPLPFGIRIDGPHTLPGRPPVAIPALVGYEMAGAKRPELVSSGH
jgi:MFS family permease